MYTISKMWPLRQPVGALLTLCFAGWLGACEASSPPAPEPASTSTTCSGPTTPIHQVQGSGPASPLAGQRVTVEGVVVGDFQARDQLGGFFLNSVTPDADPATSEGLFIFAPRAPAVAVGDRVQVRGRVKEHQGLTELTDVEQVTSCATGEPPEAMSLELADAPDLEPYEGMRVAIEDEFTVANTHDLALYGQMLLAVGGRSFEAGPDGRMAARGLRLDDGSGRKELSEPPYLDAGSRRLGDRVTGVVGIVAQTEEGHVIHPTQPPTLENTNPRPLTPPEVGGSLRVVAFNLLNFFVTFGERGALDHDEWERQLAKHIAALLALDADILALVELENNPAALSALAAELNKASPHPYAATSTPPGMGDDVIRVGFLYRPERVEAVGPARIDRAPVFRRPPMAQTFAVGDERFTVVVAHFKSKSCRNVVEGEEDRGQGCWNPLRTRQAQQMVSFVTELQAASGDPDVMVTGDLNAYGGEDPIRALTDSGLVDELALRVPEAKRYTYVYGGRSGTLDFILTSPSLATRVTGVGVWHINSDEPVFLDYRIEANPPGLYRPDPFRSSDHDPVLIGLDF
ncbi:MAG: ExeM/NucH family extracellular endonuclease [Acidobacteriota bacterium]